MKNTVFSVRPKLLPGESCWSYLIRLADQNGIPVLAMLNSIKTWEQKYIQRADFGLLDITPGSALNMEQLSRLTRQSVEELLSSTFTPLLRIFGASEEVQRARFLSGMLLDTYRFCPHCLEEAPYFRLLWKMAPVTSCVKHGVFLIERCPGCNKQMSFQDIELLDGCPHCGFSLKVGQARPIDGAQREQQKWMNEALCTLFAAGNRHIEPHEVAMRLLFLLGGKKSDFDRKLAEAALPSVLPTLLQHARDTLHQKRTLHLSFLLKTLHEHRLSMDEFFQTTIPDSFVESVTQGVVRRSDQLSCLAPWCDGYRQPGTLVKTGTTLKRRKTGKTLLYYLACTDCGCEYAIDEQGELQERTYFIEGYQALKEMDTPLAGIKELARSIRFTEDKTRRCLAYFCTRLEPDEWSATRFTVDVSLLDLVLGRIRKGTKLKAIQQWDCWESYQHFLVYRFHPEVMRALIELTRPRPSKRSDSAVKRERVREVLDEMLEKDEDITVASVCRIVGICPETIRGWGCNEEIARVKQLQRQRRLELLKKMVYEKTDEYLGKNQLRPVSSEDLHKYLGIGRTVLWRTAPEVAAYVAEQLRIHASRAYK